MVKARCIEENCNKQATWNYKTDPPRYCGDHLESRIIDGKTQYMSNKSRKACFIELCSKNISTYNKTLCIFHYNLKLIILDNLIEINNNDDLNKLKEIYKNRLIKLNKLVSVEDIKINFTNNNITKYKLQGLKTITYIEELVEFKEVKLEELNYLNSINIENLEEFKEQWMIDFKNLTGKDKEITIKEKNNNNPPCFIIGCTTSANFNIKGAKAIYCSGHAKDKKINKDGIGNLPNQIRNVRTKLCDHIFKNGLDCIKVASCGVDKKQFCLSHIEQGMHKLSKNKECKEVGCKIVPSYGFEDGIAEYCTSHIKKDMIQLYQKCINEDCKKRARYNLEGETGSRYCLKHKTVEMVDNYKDKCIEYDCGENADFNIKYIKKGIYCSLHKKDNMCSNKVIICKKEECIIAAYFGTREDQKIYCSSHINKKIHFNYQRQAEEYYDDIENNCLNKEKRVLDFLKDNNIKFINNKKIKKSPDDFRPDFLINCKTHYIIVEIDEDQHKHNKTYSKSNELRRNVSIRTNLDKPVMFIRFNPDYYLINGKNQYTLLNIKLQVLLNTINKNKDELVDGEIVYLYYDCSCPDICNNIH